MYKCKKCGTEFESKFCPNCGTPAPSKFCPACGAPLSPTDKFCPECGENLSAAKAQPLAETAVSTETTVPAETKIPAETAVPEKPKKTRPPRQASPALVKLCKLFFRAPSLLFFLFSAALVFAFLGNLTYGLFPTFGNVYQTAGLGGAAEAAPFPDICISLLVFAAFSLVYAFVLLAFRFNVRLRVKKIGAEKKTQTVTVLEYAAYLLYFVFFLLSCILCSKTKMIFSKPGAAPICILVFSLFFALVSAVAHLCTAYGEKWFPAERAEIERQKQAIRDEAGVPEPPACEKPEKPQKPKKPKKPVIRCDKKETPKLRSEVDVHIILKRYAIFLTGFALPFCVIGTIIGFIFSARKPKGWHPEKVCKRGGLIFLTVLDFLEMVGAFILLFVFGFSSLELWLPFFCGILVCLTAFIFAVVVLKQGSWLEVELWGYTRPKVFKADKDRYEAAMARYEEELNTYNSKTWINYCREYDAYRLAWSQYKRQLACYEDGVPYQWLPSRSWIGEPPSGEEKKQFSPALIKALSLLPYTVAVFFSVFSALLFLIFLGQTATAPLSKIGSIYALIAPGTPSDPISGAISEAMGLGTISGCCAALLAFAVIGALLCPCLLLFRLYIPLRVLCLKGKRVIFYLECAAFACYFVDFLLACILCGAVKSPMHPGAGPICVLVFVLLFGLCSAAAAFFYRFLPKLFPETADALKRRMAERRAAIIKPEAPEEGRLEKPIKPQYELAVKPDDALRVKVRQYEMSKLSFIAYACVEVVVFAAIALLLFFLLHITDYHLLDEMEQRWGMGIITMSIVAGVLLIFGNIFTSIFVKNYYKKRILPKKAWNPDRVWQIAVVLILAVALPILLFVLNRILMMSFTTDSSERLGNMANLIMTAAYVFIFGIYAIVLLVRSKKLCKELYGASHPKDVPELEAKHEKVWSLYLEQYSAYEERETAWRNYRRALAYFEEGVPYRPPMNDASE